MAATMNRRIHRLSPSSPGTQRELVSLHFGPSGPGPKAMIQASLHADEVPAMLVAHHLRPRLERLEAAGRLTGEVVLVPVANPIGLSQRLLQSPMGRFELGSGENFNRHYADLLDRVAALVGGALGTDASHNVGTVRGALRTACSELKAGTELQGLRKTLLSLAIDADVVLDLHCDNEAVLHLYTATPLWPRTEPLARLLGAELTLLAMRSGDDPFDEACSMPWPRLAERLAATHPEAAAALPPACLAVTVELRGETDVRHDWAEQDADAIVAFLACEGFVRDGMPASLPPLKGGPMPLAGSMPVTAPHGGVLVYRCDVGVMLRQDDPVADVVEPFSGTVTTLRSPVDGLLYARESRRFVHAGTRVAKVAGREALRSGNLLAA